MDAFKQRTDMLQPLDNDTGGGDAGTILSRFAGLGATGHAEGFGLLQRSYGVEPIGWIGWADIAPASLARALGQRFDGVGDADNTVVYAPAATGEWWVRDRRYWMAMRTFVQADAVALADMRQ